MASSSHCRVSHYGALEAIQESPSHTESLRRRNHGRSSSDSITSEESSIYNAARASLSAEEELNQNVDSNNQPKEVLDSELAANMAMFVSLKQDEPVSQVPWPTHSASWSAPKRPMSPWRRLHLLSENLTSSKLSRANSDLFIPTGTISKLDGAGQRKTLSLNDADNSSRQPRWPANLMSPASPILPKYPPPVRVPTPPGLPSFGSPEAICYSAQFLSQPRAQDPPNEQRLRETVNRIIPGRGGDSRSVRSYGDSIRRLFGFAHPPPPPPPAPSVSPIGRADDGTAVQGRFPYRQSSHGMNLSRQLEDHPFHRRTLPTANTDGSLFPSGLSSQAKVAFTPLPNPIPPPSIRQRDRLFTSHLRFSPTILPAIPQAALTARPRTPPPNAILSLPRDFSTATGTRAIAGSQGHGGGLTDGPFDRAPMRSQEAVIGVVSDGPVSLTEPYIPNRRGSRGFWGRFCCSMPCKEDDFHERIATQPPTVSLSSDSERGTNTEGYVNVTSRMEYPNYPPLDIESRPVGPSYPGLWPDLSGPQFQGNLDGSRLGD